MTRGVRSIVIAIADDSVDITHPYFQGRRQNRLTHRFKRRRHFPMPVADSDNHRTTCAGVASRRQSALINKAATQVPGGRG